MPKLSVLLFLSLFIFPCCAGFTQSLPSFEKGKLPEDLKIELLEFLTPGKKSDLFKATYQNGELIRQEGNCDECGEILYRNEYEYDTSGNWIKKKRFSDNKLISVTKRKIIYSN